MIDTGLAALFSATGTLALYASWRKLGARHLLLPAGWLLLGLSCLFWVRAAGAEFGITYAFLAMTFCAWLAVVFNYEVRRRQSDKPATPAALVLPDSRGLWRHLSLFLCVVPLAGCASIFLSVVLVHQLPWSAASALVTGIILMPVLWGLAAYWLCADARPMRPALVLAVICLLCAAYIYR